MINRYNSNTEAEIVLSILLNSRELKYCIVVISQINFLKNIMIAC